MPHEKPHAMLLAKPQFAALCTQHKTNPVAVEEQLHAQQLVNRFAAKPTIIKNGNEHPVKPRAYYAHMAVHAFGSPAVNEFLQAEAQKHAKSRVKRSRVRMPKRGERALVYRGHAEITTPIVIESSIRTTTLSGTSCCAGIEPDSGHLLVFTAGNTPVLMYRVWEAVTPRGKRAYAMPAIRIIDYTKEYVRELPPDNVRLKTELKTLFQHTREGTHASG